MFNITTSISYANGIPHIGHALEVLIADVIARYNKLKDKKVHFLTGTDEHGQKIQNTADKLEVTPKELCDQSSKLFIDMNKNMGVNYNRFIRTTDQDHKTSGRRS